MEPPKTTPPFASASLYVGDLAPDVAESFLFEIFNRIGAVASIRVCRDNVTRRSLCYAYVNYHNPADAEKAIETFNNTPLKGKPCRIMWVQRDPSTRKSNIGNLFVKNIDKSIEAKELYDAFSQFGTISSFKLARDEHGGSKGYAFVHYETQEMADNAMKKLDGSLLNNKAIQVKPFISKRDRQPKDHRFTNVFIKNLEDDIDDKRLKEIFEEFGPITSVAVAYDSDAKSKCFGFVNFLQHEDAVKAIEKMHGRALKEGGKELYVSKAQKRSERDAELRNRREQKPNKYPGCNLYVKNLDDDIDDERLRAEFTRFGTVNSVRVMRDEKGNSKGFGFVSLSTMEEANRALTELMGHRIGSKPLYVALAQRRELRRAQLEAQFRQKNQFRQQSMSQPMYSAAPLGYYPQVMYPPIAAAARAGPRGPWNIPVNQVGQYPFAYNMGPQRNARHPESRRQNTGARRSYPRGREPGAPVPGVAPAQPGAAEPMLPMIQDAHLPPLTLEQLAQVPPENQTATVGERIYAIICKMHGDKIAGKITGMLLERYSEVNDELLQLANNIDVLQEKVNEALNVLQNHQGFNDAETAQGEH